MIVKMTKTSSNENKRVDGIVRDGVLGYISHEPRIGEGVTLFYADEARKDSLIFYTTPVKRIAYEEGSWTINTQNSTYLIQEVRD